jgi:HNH endonuclease
VTDEISRNYVRNRAGSCCEYCGLDQQALAWVAFTIDHIRAKQHGGSDHTDNLAYSCIQCNLHKGPNLTGVDPDTDQIARLFNPRRDDRSEHFAMQGRVIVGLTPVGRATVRVLAMNSQRQLQNRSYLE